MNESQFVLGDHSHSSDQTFSRRTESQVEAPEINESFEDTKQIVTFSDDSSVILESLVSSAPQPFLDVSSAADHYAHSVIDFLSRPQLIETLTWESSAVRNTSIGSFRFPDALMTAMTRAKLDGFASFSASVEIRLQVNAHPFECGRLAICYTPVPVLLGDRATECARAMDRRITLPHVQLDIAKETEVVLKIPYISPLSQYDLILGETPWGQVDVVVYSPLNTPAASQLEVIVWASFSDVKLGMPTSVPIAQVGKPASSEQKGTVSGVVSTVSNLVGQAGDSISQLFPAVKNVTNPIASVGRSIGGLLAAFGLSKPVNAVAPLHIVQNPMPHFATVDGKDFGHPLAAKHGNEVILKVPFAGTETDEMNLDYVTKIPNFIQSFNYSSSTLPNTILTTIPVTPMMHSSPYALTSGSVQVPTLLAYISGFFKYWRGSLVYTFRFVKTNYHSGRVRVSFHPFAGSADVSNSGFLVRNEYVYSVVVDLREQSEVSVKVPFVAVAPFKHIVPSVDVTGNSLTNTYAGGNAHFTGVLVVSAVTPLVSSSAVVSSTIECLVEFKGGEDFELAFPCDSVYSSASSIVPASSSSVENREFPVAQVGSGFASSGTRDIRSAYVQNPSMIKDITGGKSSDTYSPVHSQECIGEKVNSIAELMKRNTWEEIASQFSFHVLPYATTLPTLVYSGEAASLSWNYGPARNIIHTSSSVFPAVTGVRPSLFVSLLNIFAFYRGGTRLKIIPSESNILVEARLTTLSRANLLNQNNSSVLPYAYDNLAVKGTGEFSIPYYSRVNTSVVGYVPTVDEPYAPITVVDISTSQRTLLGQSAADDFRCGFLLGAPLAVLLSNTSAFGSNSTSTSGFTTPPADYGVLTAT